MTTGDEYSESSKPPPEKKPIDEFIDDVMKDITKKDDEDDKDK